MILGLRKTRQQAVNHQHHDKDRGWQDPTHLLEAGLVSFPGLGGSSSVDEEDSRLRCLRRRSLCCSSSSSRVLCLARLFGMKHKEMVRPCPPQGACRPVSRQEKRLRHPWARAKGLMDIAIPTCMGVGGEGRQHEQCVAKHPRSTQLMQAFPNTSTWLYNS